MACGRLKTDPMISAFGIEHGGVSKGLPSALRASVSAGKVFPGAARGMGRETNQAQNYMRYRVAANKAGRDAARTGSLNDKFVRTGGRDALGGAEVRGVMSRKNVGRQMKKESTLLGMTKPGIPGTPQGMRASAAAQKTASYRRVKGRAPLTPPR
jgi:hypothetical protein